MAMQRGRPHYRNMQEICKKHCAKDFSFIYVLKATKKIPHVVLYFTFLSTANIWQRPLITDSSWVKSCFIP